MKDQYNDITTKMDKSIATLSHEFGSVRAGRANPTVLDSIRVDYYGAPTPIAQIASISVPEAHSIIIQPWDTNALKDIEKAIHVSGLGINPNNDGKVIRLNFPPLTEERRKELVRDIHKYSEVGKIAIRNIRRDGVEHFKALKKKSEITEDDLKIAEKDIQDLTDKYIKIIDKMLSEKEKELMSI